MSLVADAPVFAAPSRKKVDVPRGTIHAALALVVLTFALLEGSSLLSDPDTQWHVAVGRWIVTHGSVPTTDLFSYTFAGAPWIAKEWVSQLLLYFAFEAGGWRGEVLLSALVLSATFAGLHAWLSRRMRVLAALALTCFAFTLCEIHMLARPHLLVMPVIVAWMATVVGSLDRRAAPPLPAALLMTAWANMHGSFPLGLVIAGVLACEAIVGAAPGSRLLAFRRWALFLAASAAATVLSPFGWRAILVPLMMFGNADTLRFVDEWRPLQLDALGAVAAYAGVATFALLLLDARRNAFRLLAAGLLAYLMIRHARFVSLFGLIAPILVARTLSTHAPRAKRHLEVAPWTRATLAAGLFGLFGLASCAAALAFVRHPEPAPRVTPGAAFAAAMSHNVQGNVYNDYDFGGFLIAHDVKTFVDGRTDQLFLGDFLPRLMKAVRADDHADFAAIVDRAKAGWALIRPRSRTSAHFDAMPGWSRLYADENAAVYVRD